MTELGPGWVDLQVNGFKGVDFSAPGLSVEAVESVGIELAGRGIAAYCPTVITAPEAVYEANLRTLARAIDGGLSGARILGIHLEGPFFNLDCSGAHPRAHIALPDLERFQRWQEYAGGHIVLHTLAPELEGAAAYIEAVADSGVTVSLGHHLAGPKAIRAAMDAGARACTHLGNGIPATVDRHSNPIIDQLAESELEVMFIPDGHHLPPNLIRLIRAMRGRRCIAVSDCAPIAGLPEGTYTLWGTEVVLKEGLIRRLDGFSLAGSSLSLDACMEHLRGLELFTAAELQDVGRQNALRLLGRATPSPSESLSHA